MRTIIYIDGLNLYHRLLQNSIFYWVDIKKLCENILPKECNIIKIKYFTAPLSSDAGNVEIEDAHNAHFYALRAKYSPDEFECFFGYFKRHVTKAKEVSSNQFIKVYKHEEKHTDVNIAAHILNDAWLDEYDCAVLISNDSDMCEALRLIKNNSQTSGKRIILMTPTRVRNGEKTQHSKALKNISDQAYKIEEKHLKKYQMSNTITANFDTEFHNKIKKTQMPFALKIKLLSWLSLPTIDKPFQNW